MTTRNEEIYNICANIVNYMKDDIDGYNPHMSNSEYLDDLISKIDNLIDRKIPQYCGDDIRKDFKNINIGTMQSLRKILSKDISSLDGLKYLLTECNMSDDNIQEYLDKYDDENLYNFKEAYYIVKKENEELRKLLSEKDTVQPKKSSKFTRDNITKESIMSARIKIKQINGPTMEYDTLDAAIKDEALPEEYFNIKKILAILQVNAKKSSKSKYAYVCISDDTRIDFYFD